MRKLSIVILVVVLFVGCEKKAAEVNPLEFALKDLQGNEYTLSKLKGKVVIIDFWATWCRPCQQTIPIFNALYDKYKDKGVLILGIGLDKEESLKRFTEYNKISYPVLIGSQEIAKTYSISAIPHTFIIDKKGKVASHHIGFLPDLQTLLEKEIESLL
ncbi:MAG: TlpA family protein disulfide reductase [Candidatus Stahlbacteria bacterium]|nr:TlpA family protein disulfide reductase [Candidatus Stahlbacteria bacterium]